LYLGYSIIKTIKHRINLKIYFNFESQLFRRTTLDSNSFVNHIMIEEICINNKAIHINEHNNINNLKLNNVITVMNSGI
jgi:hypothetical protein